MELYKLLSLVTLLGMSAQEDSNNGYNVRISAVETKVGASSDIKGNLDTLKQEDDAGSSGRVIGLTTSENTDNPGIFGHMLGEKTRAYVANKGVLQSVGRIGRSKHVERLNTPTQLERVGISKHVDTETEKSDSRHIQDSRKCEGRCSTDGKDHFSLYLRTGELTEKTKNTYDHPRRNDQAGHVTYIDGKNDKDNNKLVNSKNSNNANDTYSSDNNIRGNYMDHGYGYFIIHNDQRALESQHSYNTHNPDYDHPHDHHEGKETEGEHQNFKYRDNEELSYDKESRAVYADNPHNADVESYSRTLEHGVSFGDDNGNSYGKEYYRSQSNLDGKPYDIYWEDHYDDSSYRKDYDESHNNCKDKEYGNVEGKISSEHHDIDTDYGKQYNNYKGYFDNMEGKTYDSSGVYKADVDYDSTYDEHHSRKVNDYGNGDYYSDSHDNYNDDHGSPKGRDYASGGAYDHALNYDYQYNEHGTPKANYKDHGDVYDPSNDYTGSYDNYKDDHARSKGKDYTSGSVYDHGKEYDDHYDSGIGFDHNKENGNHHGNYKGNKYAEPEGKSHDSDYDSGNSYGRTYDNYHDNQYGDPDERGRGNSYHAPNQGKSHDYKYNSDFGAYSCGGYWKPIIKGYGSGYTSIYNLGYTDGGHGHSSEYRDTKGYYDNHDDYTGYDYYDGYRGGGYGY